jgi:hypothetical protein
MSSSTFLSVDSMLRLPGPAVDAFSHHRKAERAAVPPGRNVETPIRVAKARPDTVRQRHSDCAPKSLTI